jgi:protein-S-isoprenylcysteine O-methyltransferase Ste14
MIKNALIILFIIGLLYYCVSNKKDKEEIYSISIRVKNEEKFMVQELKEKYSLNINKLFKNFIREHYAKVIQITK